MRTSHIPQKLTVLAIALVVAPIASVRLDSQAQKVASPKTASPAKGAWVQPHTAWGDPDLQGVWNFATLTPLERPRDLGDKQTLTGQEAEQFAKQALEQRNATLSTGDREWWDPGSKVLNGTRTSLVVDPPDGRVPALTQQARDRAAARAAERRGRGPADSWEDMSLSVRCIWFGSAGPPMLPGPYNNDVEFFQTPNSVVMLNEMIHDVRVIPTDSRPSGGSGIRQWMGDSRGHWEGNTLVIETTNFTGDRNFRGSSENLQLVERFTRVSAGTINYEFTATDPTTWTRPWTASFAMSKIDEPMYEYACHEGNYKSLAGTLAAARAEEAAAKKK